MPILSNPATAMSPKPLIVVLPLMLLACSGPKRRQSSAREAKPAVAAPMATKHPSFIVEHYLAIKLGMTRAVAERQLGPPCRFRLSQTI